MGKKDKKKGKKKAGRQHAAAKPAKTALDLRKAELPGRPKPMKPADIRALRESLNASQALLARLLNVSSNAVESWEQGIREPRQATLKLLHIAKKNPSVLLD
ncbi:MAG TPA: helix-turn-helix domain-containing protein [Candidatus Angelobacter sp.]|jgi:putative transcriptional regulator|nr:helix-turn-helix domain-containing protein [Candidatus Angelobacter sp.]